MSKLKIILLVAILLISSMPLLANQPAQAAPPSIIYQAPITIDNTQPVATPNPFQQMIQLSESTYKAYIHYNQSSANFEFSYANNTIIPAWIESNNSGTLTIWLKIYSIPASSSIKIYIDFASLTTNLLSSSGTTGIGEAPQLSPIYAQYDNGVNVFPFYDNFAGTALKSSWSAFTSSNNAVVGTITVNNGLTLSGGTYWWGIKNTYTVPLPSVLEYYGEQTQSGGYGPAIGTYTGVLFEQRTPGSNWGIEPTSSGMPNLGVYSGSSAYNTWYLVSGNYNSGAEALITDYTTTQVTATYSVGSSNLTLDVYGSPTNGVIQWTRVRAYPPNGVIPTVEVIA